MGSQPQADAHNPPAVALLQKLNAGMPALQRLFERAVNHRQTRTSPLLWRCYLAYELHRRRPENARRIMLRAVHACTWCKALWLDGIQALAHQVSSDLHAGVAVPGTLAVAGARRSSWTAYKL